MLKLAVESMPKITISPIESRIYNNKISISYNTLFELSSLYPSTDFKWIIGSDALSTFNLWHSYEKILLEYGVFLYERKGYPLIGLQRGMTVFNKLIIPNISSTVIRQRIKNNKKITTYVGKKVSEYIKNQKLYL